MKKYNYIYLIIILFSVIVGICTRVQLANIYSLNSDMIEHYYHMRQYYDNKIFPVTGALLEGGTYIGILMIIQKSYIKILHVYLAGIFI